MVIVRVKRINPDIKILAVANESEKTRVLDYGADGFTTKPISVETIVDKVSTLLTVGKKCWIIGRVTSVIANTRDARGSSFPYRLMK